MACLLGSQTVRAQERCAGLTETRFWEIQPDHWRLDGTPRFPETGTGRAAQRPNLGVAFSGGGTRSMAATVGQLRGLRQNGWLDRVRYISAVSGGSWAAVPYTFYRDDLDELLGTFMDPGDLEADLVRREPSGRLAARIVDADLLPLALPEILDLLPREEARGNLAALQNALVHWTRDSNVLSFVESAERRRPDKAYARILGGLFLDARGDQPAIVPRGTSAPYTWDRIAAGEIAAVTRCPTTDFVHAAANRPFLIVGAALILNRPAFTYPRLVPVEFTPLYTGIRQQFGRLGGTYVSPWAYDRSFGMRGSKGRIRVGPGPLERTVTLADVLAASGAAPVLALLERALVPARFRSRAVAAFPSFNHVTVRDDGGAVFVGPTQLHGDGGFVDNLALMPLLARQVKNIIVFVNAEREWHLNDQLESYFTTLNVRDIAGDKGMNAVFDHDKYWDLRAAFDQAAASGDAAVYCGHGWTVSRNELYNVRGYRGLNICWVYNHAADNWTKALPSAIQKWLTGPPPEGGQVVERRRAFVSGRRKWQTSVRSEAPAGYEETEQLEDFPYFATFFQNAPRVVRLTILQVNLLAHLAAWSITEPTAVATVRRGIGEDVIPVTAASGERNR